MQNASFTCSYYSIWTAFEKAVVKAVLLATQVLLESVTQLVGWEQN